MKNNFNCLKLGIMILLICLSNSKPEFDFIKQYSGFKNESYILLLQSQQYCNIFFKDAFKNCSKDKMEKYKNIEKIQISGCKFTCKQAKTLGKLIALSNMKFKLLKIDNVTIKDSGAKFIIDGLKKSKNKVTVEFYANSDLSENTKKEFKSISN